MFQCMLNNQKANIISEHVGTALRVINWFLGEQSCKSKHTWWTESEYRLTSVQEKKKS